MACDCTELSVVGYANAFTIWHYRTADPLTAVLAPGYFDGAHRLIETGDLMVLNTGGGHALAFVLRADRRAVALQALGAVEPADTGSHRAAAAPPPGHGGLTRRTVLAPCNGRPAAAVPS